MVVERRGFRKEEKTKPPPPPPLRIIFIIFIFNTYKLANHHGVFLSQQRCIRVCSSSDDGVFVFVCSLLPLFLFLFDARKTTTTTTTTATIISKTDGGNNKKQEENGE